jgi:hypothetical protein
MRKFLFSTLLLLAGTCQALSATVSISGTGTVTRALPGIGVSVDDALRFEATVSDEVFSAFSHPLIAQTEYKLASFEARIGAASIGNLPTDGSGSMTLRTQKDGPTQVTLYLSHPGTFETDARFHNLTIIWEFASDEMDTSFAALAALDFSTAVHTSVWAVDTRDPHDIGMEATLRAAPAATVPLPAGIWLGLAGLAALGLSRRGLRA